MLIAHLAFSTAATDRDRALAALLDEAPEVRAMPGNLLFQPFADPASPTGLGVIHEWDSAEAFAGYLASPAFARSSQLLRPLMTVPPVSKRFEARLLETVA